MSFLSRLRAAPIVLLLLCAAPSAAQDAVPPRQPAVVEHHGDTALRDRLIAQQEVWYDAGEFLVGRFDAAALETLGRAGVACRPFEDRGELAVVAAEDARDPAARVLHRSARQALVAVAGAGPATPRAHGRGVLVQRTAMRAAPPAPSGAANLVAGDARVQALVDQVDAQNVLATVQTLSAIPTRRAVTTGAVTAQNLIDGWLQGLGLATTLQSFQAQYSRNVIAEIPGSVHPERIVVLGAHYDSIAGGVVTAPAPGADDNASGTAGVLEAARVLAAGGPYENTLRFALFSAEEYGLVGSTFAAQQSLAQGEQIVAMINLDMIAYRAAGDARDVDFATNNTTAALVDQCRALGATYVPGWASTSGVLTAGTSDHQAYFTRGFPAVFLFEDLTQYSPYIHSANDTAPQSTNDPDLARMIVQGVVASAATLAVPTCTAPTNVCVAAPNSVGAGAILGWAGTTSVARNDLTLVASGVRPGANGLFFWGVGETQVPLGNGFRCVAGSIQRLRIVAADAAGSAALAVDQLGYPGGPLVGPGDVRVAQLWYRDVAGGGAGYNLSDALRLTFCP